MNVRIDSALDEAECLDEADLGQRRQVVTTGEDAHVTELVQREAAGSHSHGQVESFLLHQQSVAVHVQFEQYLSIHRTVLAPT